VQRYRARISGPLLDRIDAQCLVPRAAAGEVALDGPPGETSAAVAVRVAVARARMVARQGVPNARLGVTELTRHALPDRAGRALLERAVQQALLSARAQARVLMVARSIADLAGHERVGAPQVAEAVALRAFDRAG